MNADQVDTVRASIAAARLLRKMADTPLPAQYDNYVTDAYDSLMAARGVAQDNLQIPVDERSNDLDFIYTAEADVASRLAIAEQARIANLIAMATYERAQDHRVEATACIEMAREALGLG